MIWRCGVLFTLLILSTDGAKLHESMTEDEIKSVFHLSPEKMHELDYEVVHVVHKESRVRRSTDTPPTDMLKLRAFNQDYTLYMEQNNHVLVGTNTPIFLASINNNRAISYNRVKFPMPTNFKIYHDLRQRAAITMSTDSDGKVHVNGVVGDDLVIRSLPARFHQQDVQNPRGDYNQYYYNNSVPTQHIVMKVNANNFYQTTKIPHYKPEEVAAKDIDMDFQFTPVSGGANQETVYPQVLVAIDYDTYELHSNNLESLAHYMIAFWNAVDLRFREMSSPGVRLNIAGIVVPTSRQSVPYMESAIATSDAIYSEETLLNLVKFFDKKELKNLVEWDVVLGMSKRFLAKFQGGSLKKDLGGVAVLGGACKYNQHVALINDKGGFGGVNSAAHELAHTLGAPHDDASTASIPGGPCDWNDGYLMSYALQDERGQHWSKCSITAMRIFLSKNDASCLRNKPNVGSPYRKEMPGRLLTRDQQCMKEFNVLADKSQETNCVALWCQGYKSQGGYLIPQSMGRLAPPAEGTKCGLNRICLNGLCVRDPEL